MSETKEQKAARMKVYNQRPEVKERAAMRERTKRYAMNAKVRALRDKPCIDCGVELPPEIMEFDHVRGDKRFEFPQAIGFKLELGEDRWEVILAEVAKCDVRCPNCHKMRHFNEQNGHFGRKGGAYCPRM